MNAQAKVVPAKVYEAIAAVTEGIAKDGIAKGRSNQQQGYKFRGIDDVYNALSPFLAKHRLCILPRVLSREVVERQTAKGNAIFYTTVEVEFDFVSAEDGSLHTVKTFGEAMDTADKSTNKAMSAAYKYAAMQAFCIPTEGDNDADATTHDVSSQSASSNGAEPVEKLPGIHKIKERLRIMQTAGNSADTLDVFNALVSSNAADLTKIKEANHSWWTGDGEDFEGFKSWIVRRRAELNEPGGEDEGMFSMLIASLKECQTLQAMTNWMATNEALIAELDGAESRKFEMAYNLHESAILETARVNA
jgi:hypothetical protein